MKILSQPEIFMGKDFFLLRATTAASASPVPCNQLTADRCIFDAIYRYKLQIYIKCGSLAVLVVVLEIPQMDVLLLKRIYESRGFTAGTPHTICTWALYAPSSSVPYYANCT